MCWEFKFHQKLMAMTISICADLSNLRVPFEAFVLDIMPSLNAQLVVIALEVLAKILRICRGGSWKVLALNTTVVNSILHEYTSIKYDAMVGKGVQMVMKSVVPREGDVAPDYTSNAAEARPEVLTSLGHSFEDRNVKDFIDLFHTDE